MPYLVRWKNGAGEFFYAGKNGCSTSDLKRARVYQNLGALKNSLSHWDDISDMEIVEVELKETGMVVQAWVLMDPVEARRKQIKRDRELRELTSRKNYELAELKRLKEKYNG